MSETPDPLTADALHEALFAALGWSSARYRPGRAHHGDDYATYDPIPEGIVSGDADHADWTALTARVLDALRLRDVRSAAARPSPAEPPAGDPEREADLRWARAEMSSAIRNHDLTPFGAKTEREAWKAVIGRWERVVAALRDPGPLAAEDRDRAQIAASLRDALVDVLANRAEPPEYPGLALVPVRELDSLERLAVAWRVNLHKPHDQAGDPIEGFPTCSICGAIQTVLALKAETPEPPRDGLLDAKRVRRLLGDHHRLLRTSARNCSICWNEREFLAATVRSTTPPEPEDGGT